MTAKLPTEDHIAGCLLGTAYGDALGLPYEGLAPGRAGRMLGDPSRFRFFLGRGMVSDDTEHAIMVALSLIGSARDPQRFSVLLSRHLRLWFLALPAGMGFATLRAILKLLVGFPPSRSGVHSAGNGPAMRAPLLGVVAADADELRALTSASTVITHRDPRALHGALAVALAAHLGTTRSAVTPAEFLDELSNTLAGEGDEMLQQVTRAVRSVEAGESSRAFADGLGLSRGVTGYVMHTVPVCIHAWLGHPSDPAEAIREVIRCGGDADTTAAIVGGIAGAQAGAGALPAAALAKLLDWPWNAERICRLAAQVARLRSPAGDPALPPEMIHPWWLLRLPRNLFFLLIVLFHGFRRLLPPY